MESPNVPWALEAAIRHYQLPVELKQVTYFLGRETWWRRAPGKWAPAKRLCLPS
jgi:hypothetical protein